MSVVSLLGYRYLYLLLLDAKIADGNSMQKILIAIVKITQNRCSPQIFNEIQDIYYISTIVESFSGRKYKFLISRFKILPVGPFGKLSTTKVFFGILKDAKHFLQC